MRKITYIFWLVFWLFVYKISFLEKDTTTTANKFSIFRDKQGIPHVYAKSYRDLFFGLGYAQAQDRLFTLFFKKMMIEGRMAELFGPPVVPSDMELRNIGFMEMAKTNKLHTDPQTLQYLQEYANGINEYAKSSKMLPFEFYLFWLNWQNWQIQDTLATINLLSFTLQFDWFYEIARQRLLETVGFDLGIKTITYGGKNLFRNTSIISDEELKEMGRYKQYDFEKQTETLRKYWQNNNISLGSVNFPSFQFAVEGAGSNSWVIGQQYTKNGRPILASDPHLGSMIPTIFYCHESILLTEDNEVKSRKFGVMPDGVPTMSIGISQIAAWGTTAAYIDNKDVYYETVRNNSGKFQYLYQDEWHDFRQRKEVIKVRGGQDILQTFYHTHRGVVIEQIFMDIHWKYGYPLPQKYRNNHTLTLVPTHYRPDNSSAKGLTSLLTFQSYQQFQEAGYDIQYPNIDSTFIFLNGTFGYKGLGAIPKRQIPQMGSFIKDGNTNIFDMGDLLNSSQKPKLIDPKKGYVSMCNNRFASDHYQFRSSLHQITTGRSFRLQKIIKDNIAKNIKFDFQLVKHMQLDLRDQFIAEILQPLLGKLTHLRQIWSNPQTEQIFEKLQSWNFTIGKDSTEASYYHVWEYNFQHSLFKFVNLTEQEIHAIINHGFFQNYQFTLFQKIINKQLTSQQWPVCESYQTRKYPSYHPCEVSIALALKNLPDELRSVFKSDDHSEYKWGTIHNQYFKIIPFGQIPILKKIWQRNFPAGGNSRTLNVAIQTHQSKTYNSFASPSFRLISDLNQTYFSLQVGESDRIFSPYYDNFVGQNRYVKFTPVNPYKEEMPEEWSKVIDQLND